MRIIILKGGDNVGKSTTLNAVYDELISFSGVQNTPKRILGDPIQNDFECIVTLKDKRKVAFFTMGDEEDELKKGIEKYSYLDCEVLIIAFNSKYNTLFNQIIIHYPYNLIEKSQPFKKDDSKWKDVGTILSLI